MTKNNYNNIDIQWLTIIEIKKHANHMVTDKKPSEEFVKKIVTECARAKGISKEFELDEHIEYEGGSRELKFKAGSTVAKIKTQRVACNKISEEESANEYENVVALKNRR